MINAGLTIKSDNTARCNPTDPYCQRFCIKEDNFDAENYKTGVDLTLDVTGEVTQLAPFGDQFQSPYGLYEANVNNTYGTTDHDRGNCYQNGDTAACRNVVFETSLGETMSDTESKTKVETALNDAMSFFVSWGDNALDSALVALGIETGVDDWNVNVEGQPPIAPNWEQCKASALDKPEDTSTDPNCPNTGCPRDIIVTYELPDSVRTFYRPCMPTLFGSTGEWLTSQVESAVEEIAESSAYSDSIASISKSGSIILWCMLIAVGLSYFLIILMKWVVRPLIVLLCIAAMLLIIVVCAVLWYMYSNYTKQLDLLEDPANASDSLTRNIKFFHGLSIVWTIFTGIMFLLLVALRKKIWIAATLYMEASKALFSTPSMLFSPIINWAFFFGTAFTWCWVALLLATSQDTAIQTEPTLGQGHVKNAKKYEADFILFFHIFMGLWGFAFLAAAHEFVIAGCITNWYKFQGEAPNFALFRSMGRLGRYHLGSVALGSLIIAICQLIIAILLYIQHKAEKAGADSIAGYIIKCLVCCMWCFKKCMQFINRNAYIEINLFGYSFCNAAIEAFHTLLNNFVQVAASNFVGGLVFFTLRVLVVSLNMVISYYWITNMYQQDASVATGSAVTDASVGEAIVAGASIGLDGTTTTVAAAVAVSTAANEVQFALPMIIIAIFTYLVMGTFTELLDMTTDTILICYCEDIQYNSAAKGTLLAPESLLKALGKYQAQLEGLEKEEAVAAGETLARRASSATGLGSGVTAGADVKDSFGFAEGEKKAEE